MGSVKVSERKTGCVAGELGRAELQDKAPDGLLVSPHRSLVAIESISALRGRPCGGTGWGGQACRALVSHMAVGEHQPSWLSAGRQPGCREWD